MLALLRAAGLGARFVEELDPEGATRIWVSCKLAWRLAGQDDIVSAAFALTRPKQIRAAKFSLKTWKKIWANCVEAVVEEGWNPAVWYHSCQLYLHKDEFGIKSLKCSFVLGWLDNVVRIAQESQLNNAGSAPGHAEVGLCFQFDESQTSSNAPLCDLACILAMNGSLHEWSYDDGDVRLKVCAVCLLSDLRYAVVTSSYQRNGRFFDAYANGIFFVGSSMRAAILKASSNLGSCPWHLDGGGRLVMAVCGQLELEALPTTTLLPWPPTRLLGMSGLDCRRIARDGVAYTCSEFFDWYDCVSLAWRRWNEAGAMSVQELRLQGMLFRWSAAQRPPPPCNLQLGTRSRDVSCVIQPIQHDEPPAVVDSTEAKQVCEQQWAGFLEHQILQATVDAAEIASHAMIDFAHEEVVLLDFNRNPKDMRRALTEGRPLQMCRQGLHMEGHEWELPNGALVFVSPCQYRSVMQALVGFELKPSHVVVASSLEYLVEESVVNIKKGVWVKERQVLKCEEHGTDSISSSSLVQASGPEWWDPDVYHVKRTFVCLAPPRRNATSVTQSTTEADQRNPCNPRRHNTKE